MGEIYKSAKKWLRFFVNLAFAITKIPVFIILGTVGRSLIKWNFYNLAGVLFHGGRLQYLRLVTEIPLAQIEMNEEATTKILKTIAFFNDVLIKNKSVEDTQEYKEMISNVEKGYLPKGCGNQEEVEKYFLNLVSTFANIRNHGYKPQSRINSVFFHQFKNPHVSKAWPLPHEAKIKIDQNGRYVWVSQGLHRIAIAKFLGIESIYALIVAAPQLELEKFLRQAK